MVGPCEVILKSANQCIMSSVVKIVIGISQKTSLLFNGQYTVSGWSVIGHHAVTTIFCKTSASCHTYIIAWSPHGHYGSPKIVDFKGGEKVLVSARSLCCVTKALVSLDEKQVPVLL